MTTGQEKEEEDISKYVFMDEVKTFTAFKIATFLANYWFPILVPVGFVGNTLSFVAMTKANNRNVSTCIYMTAISINDNLMVYLCIHVFLVVVPKTHKWHPIKCSVIGYLVLFALQNSTFQILAMTIDKYIAIKWPHRAAVYSSLKRAKMIAIGFSICALMYNAPHLYLSRIVGDQCAAYGISNLIARVYSWISFVINTAIPFTLLIHINYVIVKTVRSSRRMFRTGIGGGNEQGLDVRQKALKTAENQLTIMLLLVTTLFLILLWPTYFRFIYMSFVKRDTPFQYANAMLIYQVSSKLYTTNSGLNFFLYCIKGKKFRNDLKEILCFYGRTD